MDLGLRHHWHFERKARKPAENIGAARMSLPEVADS